MYDFPPLSSPNDRCIGIITSLVLSVVIPARQKRIIVIVMWGGGECARQQRPYGTRKDKSVVYGGVCLTEDERKGRWCVKLRFW